MKNCANSICNNKIERINFETKNSKSDFIEYINSNVTSKPRINNYGLMFDKSIAEKQVIKLEKGYDVFKQQNEIAFEDKIEDVMCLKDNKKEESKIFNRNKPSNQLNRFNFYNQFKKKSDEEIPNLDLPINRDEKQLCQINFKVTMNMANNNKNTYKKISKIRQAAKSYRLEDSQSELKILN